jgi:predicted MFS family arabinose efflux permease
VNARSPDARRAANRKRASAPGIILDTLDPPPAEAGTRRDPLRVRVGAPRRVGLILFSLWLLVFTSSGQLLLMVPLLPRMARELAVPEAMIGTAVAVESAMMALLALLVGPLSDRVGRRRILLAGAAMMAAALALHLLAVDFRAFVLVRALAGVAGGTLSGAAVSYLGDLFPYARRGWANGWVMSGMAFGLVAGIPLGSLLAATFGFRAAFAAFAVLSGCAALLIWRVVPQPAIQRAPEPVRPARVLRQYAQLLSRREVLTACAAAGLLFAGTALFLLYFPAWLESARGAVPRQIALLFLCGGLGSMVGGPLAGRLSDRVGRRRVIVAACGGLALVSALATVVVTAAWVAYPVFFAMMALLAARVGPFQSLVTALASDDRRGTLVSLVVGAGQLGYAAGGALAGAVYGRLGYAGPSVLAAAALLGAVVLVWRSLPEPPLRRPIRGPRPGGRERRAPARAARSPVAPAGGSR